MDFDFYQMIFLHFMRWLYFIYPFSVDIVNCIDQFSNVKHFISGTNSFDHGVLLFLYIVGLNSAEIPIIA